MVGSDRSRISTVNLTLHPKINIWGDDVLLLVNSYIFQDDVTVKKNSNICDQIPEAKAH